MSSFHTMKFDYDTVLSSYGYGPKDKFISRMFLYPASSTKKSSTYHFHYNDLVKELSTCSKNDLYISMNDFTKPSRKEENLYHLKHFYVDLDTYHSAYADLPYCNEFILQQLEELYFGIKFPEPNLVVSSGRGMYLIWNINEHKNALPRWKTVQKYLCQLLTEFGADSKVSTDCARVLRVPGSINTKSGNYVKILSSNSEKHSIYEFLAYYMPDSYLDGIRKHEQIRSKLALTSSSVTPKEKVTTKLESKIAFFHNNSTLLQSRLTDLETLLLKFRDKEHGSKEYIFFLYRMWALSLYKDEKKVEEMMLTLNQRLQYNADPIRLLKETQSAVKYYNDKKIRLMRNETIIRFLSITEEEMESLSTIISPSLAAYRKSLRNRRAYLTKLESSNKVTKKEAIDLRLSKIARFLEAGYTKTEISTLIGISYRQTLRDVKLIQELGIESFLPAVEELFSTTEIDDKISSSEDVTNIQPYLLQDVVPVSIVPDSIRTLSSLSFQCKDFGMNRVFHYDINAFDLPCTIREYLQKLGYSSQNITDLKKYPDSVCVNDTPVFLNTLLNLNDHLTVYVKEKPNISVLAPLALPFPVVYEDEDLVVVNKPASMSIHPSMRHYEDTLANAAAYYYIDRLDQFVFRCINRLDRDTSGLTILAKNAVSAGILSQSMMNRKIHREYLAVVLGCDLPDDGIITAPIGRKDGSIIERVVDYDNGERAVTHYHVLKRENGISLLTLWLETGRTHQIRVHMKQLGYPLLGDFLYYPEGMELIQRQALHSYRLSFPHPITGEQMHITAPVPEDIRALFQDGLSDL